MSGIEKSLARYLSSARNMLINGFFEHVDVPRIVSHVGAEYLPTPDREIFQSAPGWFVFGGSENGNISRPDNYTYATLDNPFASEILGERVDPSSVVSHQKWANGVVVQQESNKLYGIVQPILRGAALKRAKRVRITGAYQILDNTGGGGISNELSGIHIFLKKSLKKASISSATVDSGAASLTRFSATQVDDPAQNFLSTVVVGDVLAIDTIGYFNVTSVTSDTRLTVSPNLPAWGGGMTYRLTRPTSTSAKLDGGQRVLMSNDTGFVAHLSTADNDFLHPNSWVSITGTEALIRAWDYLSIGPTTTSDIYAHHLVLGESTAVPGAGLGLRNSNLTDYHVWSLTTNVTTTGSDGDLLYSVDESQGNTVTPTSDIIYFDETVELGTSSSSDNHGEYFLVVCPVGDNLNFINTSVTIVLWALSLSIVDSDDEDSTGLISSFASARRGGPMEVSGFPAKYLASYPMYVPATHPLSVDFKTAKTGNVGIPTFLISAGGPMAPQPPIFQFSTNPAIGGGEFFVARQVGLPPGSVVLGMGIPVGTKAGVWTTAMNLELVEGFCPPPYDTSDRYGTGFISSNDSLGRKLLTLDIPTSVVAQTVYRSTASYRNRLGLWDGGAANENIISIDDTENARMGAASVFCYMNTPQHNGPGSTILQFRDGWIYTVYDPRWGQSSTHWA